MKASTNRQILALALPSIASNITVPLLWLCEVTIMGHIGGATSIAAIAVGSMIFNVMHWLFGFLRMGTSGITAQALGHSEANGEDVVDEIPKTSLMAALGLSLVIVVLQWLSFWLMQVPADVAVLCTHYYYICVWGAPATLGLYSLTGWFIGMQDTRTPMMLAIVGITATRTMLWTCLAAAVVFFAVYLLLRTTMANHALWLAMTAYLALRGLLQTVAMKRSVLH